MSRITLTAINSRYSHTNLALLYLQAELNRHSSEKNDFSLIEWDINRSSVELLEKLISSDSNIYLFSVYVWNSVFIRNLIADLRKLKPRALICIGGPDAVYNKTEWLGKTEIDYILDGNADEFAEVILNLKKPESPGVLTQPHRHLNEAPFPYDENSLKALRGRIIYYEASRGCIYNCSYCLSSADSEKTEYRTASQIKDEIYLLSRFEGTVKFVDRTFNSNPAVSRLTWRLMAENPPAGCFHFELHPMLLSDEDFELIENLKPGSAQFEIGIQSTDKRVLENVNRIDRTEESFDNIRRLSDMQKFRIHLDQIIGLPGDSPETASTSINRILSLKPDIFQAGFLKIIPGTPLSENLEPFGIKASSQPPYEVMETDAFPYNEIRRFKKTARLIDIIYNSRYYTHSLNLLAERTGSWYDLFNSILKDGSYDLNCRRWEYWAEKLHNLAVKTMGIEKCLFTDLLRLDWCPQANSQHYPELIAYENRADLFRLKTEACLVLAGKYPAIRKSEFKRAIIFIPEYEGNLPVKGPCLFLKTGGIQKQFSVSKYPGK